MQDLAQSWILVPVAPFLEESFSDLLQAALGMLEGWEGTGLYFSPAAGPEQGIHMSECEHL